MWVLIVLLSSSTMPCLARQSRPQERFSDIEGMYERRLGKRGATVLCFLVSRLEKRQKTA